MARWAWWPRSEEMGLTPVKAELDLDALRGRIAAIEARLEGDTCRLLDSQGVRLLTGTGRLTGPNSIVVDTAGRRRWRWRPTRCSWPPAAGPASRTGRRSTATASSPPARRTRRSEMPEHLVVIGSGVTGVEFVHMFSSLGQPGHADRLAPAGAAPEGPRGGGRPRGGAPPPGRAPAQGGAGRGRRRRRRRGRRALRRRARREGLARAAGHRLGAEQRGARARGGRRPRRRRRVRADRRALPHERRRTSTPPATSPGSCRCRRSRRCRAARSPST